MSDVVAFREGGYRYIKAVFQYSSGVAAEPGVEIERVRLLKPLPLAEGYAAIEAHLKALGRPSTAFAACELRSPAPFTELGFLDFNREYVKTLARWGIYKDEINLVARTNVCPEHGKPAQPSLYAFSYTVPAPNAKRGNFIIAGGGEARGGEGNPRLRSDLRADQGRYVALWLQKFFQNFSLRFATFFFPAGFIGLRELAIAIKANFQRAFQQHDMHVAHE